MLVQNAYHAFVSLSIMQRFMPLFRQNRHHGQYCPGGTATRTPLDSRETIGSWNNRSRGVYDGASDNVEHISVVMGGFQSRILTLPECFEYANCSTMYVARQEGNTNPF